MIVVFKKDYLKELYEQGVAKKKKYRFQPQIVRRYQDRINFLIKGESRRGFILYKVLAL